MNFKKNRSTLFGLSCLFALVIAAYHSFIFPLTALPGDMAVFNYPYLSAMKRGLAEQTIPLWFPEVLFGGYGLSEVGIALLHPSKQLLRILDAAWVVKLEAIFSLFLFWWGTWFWLKEQKLGRFLAAAGATFGILLFQTRGLATYGHLTVINAMAIYPWLLWACCLLAKQKDKKGLIKISCFLSFLYAFLWVTAHPQFIFIYSEFAFLYFIFELWRQKERWSFTYPIIAFIIAFILGFGIGSPQVIESLASMEETGRVVTRTDKAFLNSGSFHPVLLLKNFFPDALGSREQYWGINDFWFGQLLPGLIALFICILGWFKLSIHLKGLSLLFLLLAFGQYTPLYQLHTMIIPGADLFRYPSRYLYTLTPLLTWSFVLGLNYLINSNNRRKLCLIGLVSCLLSLLFIPSLGILSPILPNHVAERYQLSHISNESWIPIALSIGLFITLFYYNTSIRLLCILVLCIVCSEHLIRPISSVPIPPSVNTLDSYPEERVLVINNSSIHNHSLFNGVSGASAYCNLIPQAYRELLDCFFEQNWKKQNRIQVYNTSEDILASLGYSKVYKELDKNLKPSVLIKEIENPIERFYLPNSWVDVPIEKAKKNKELIKDRQLTLRKSLETQYGNTNPLAAKANLEVLEIKREFVSLKIKTDSPTIISSRERVGVRWRASINEEATKIQPWLGTFRSIFVPKGEHEVRFYIDREPFKKSIILSLFLIISISVVWLIVSFKIKRSVNKN